MIIVVITSLLAIAVIVYVLAVRDKDLPEPEPVSPFQHLDERKAAIYDNLRDLQFEYRLGKLSDADYQTTKRDLQKELATVLAEVDALKTSLNGNGAAPAPPPPLQPKAAGRAADKFVCEHCQAQFAQPLKFCGECGKPMKAHA